MGVHVSPWSLWASNRANLTSSAILRTTKPLSAIQASGSRRPPRGDLTRTEMGLLGSWIGAPLSASASARAARMADLLVGESAFKGGTRTRRDRLFVLGVAQEELVAVRGVGHLGAGLGG